jgi:hypothetical protein
MQTSGSTPARWLLTSSDYAELLFESKIREVDIEVSNTLVQYFPLVEGTDCTTRPSANPPSVTV